MKKTTIFSIALFAAFGLSHAQQTEIQSKKVYSDYNHWSVEINGGLNKAFDVFGNGFTKGYGDDFAFRHTDLGIRYMLTTKVGVKADVGYDSFTQSDGTPEFKSHLYKFGLQGVVNIGRMFDFQDWTNTLGILAHAGGSYTQFHGTYKENIASLIGGLTLQAKLSKHFAVTLDGTLYNNFGLDQTFNGGSRASKLLSVTATVPGGTYNGSGTVLVDGNTGTTNTTVVIPAQTVTATTKDPSTQYLKEFAPVANISLGLTYYFGRKIHADWYAPAPVIPTVQEVIKEVPVKDQDLENKVKELENKINELEAKLADTDGDGVIDLIDACPTVPGPASNHGCPKVDASVYAQEATGALKGILFDFNKATIKTESAEKLNQAAEIIKSSDNGTFLVTGHTDKKGNDAYNLKLSQQRAASVVSALEARGVNGNQLKSDGVGERDAQVPETASDEERQSDRKVVVESINGAAWDALKKSDLPVVVKKTVKKTSKRRK